MITLWPLQHTLSHQSHVENRKEKLSENSPSRHFALHTLLQVACFFFFSFGFPFFFFTTFIESETILAVPPVCVLVCGGRIFQTISPPLFLQLSTLRRERRDSRCSTDLRTEMLGEEMVENLARHFAPFLFALTSCSFIYWKAFCKSLIMHKNCRMSDFFVGKLVSIDFDMFVCSIWTLKFLQLKMEEALSLRK